MPRSAWRTVCKSGALPGLIVPCGSPMHGPDALRLPGEEDSHHQRVNGHQTGRSNLAADQADSSDARSEVATRRLLNDNAVNLMHDGGLIDVAGDRGLLAPRARGSARFHRLASFSLGYPSIDPPPTCPGRSADHRTLGNRLQKRYAEAGLPHARAGPSPARTDDVSAPSFNLASALQHACGGVAFVHETCCGVRTPPYP